MFDLHHLPGADLHEQNAVIHRRHILTLIPTLISAGLVCAIPIGIYMYLMAMQPDVLSSEISRAVFIMSASAFFLFGWLFSFILFMEYWLDVFIVTERRIIDIDQIGLFGHTVSELRLYRIQDVTAQSRGILQSIFSYGDIFIQTAAETERFHFAKMPYPNKIAKEIMELAESDRKVNLASAVEEISETSAGKK